MTSKCPTCGSQVEVVTGEEGTSHFIPIEKRKPPAYKQSKDMLIKRRKAVRLKGQGKTIREIMQIMGYNSTSAVAHLLKQKEDKDG